MKGNVQEYQQLLASHEARMEPLLAELLEQKKLSFDDFVLTSLGTFSRGYLKDIIDCTIKKYNNQEYLSIGLSREGLYDMLPKAIFHAQEKSSPTQSTERYITDNSRREQEREQEAKNFFLPIEQEFYRLKINIEQEERRLIQGFLNPLQNTLFKRFWQDATAIEEEYKDILLYLLPLTHKIAGNDETLADCLSTLLGEQVQITRISKKADDFEEIHSFRVNNMNLGVDFILGNTIASEVDQLLVAVGPVKLNTIRDYLTGGAKQKLLEIFCECFVPFELDYVFHISLEETQKAFVFNDDMNTSRLGYSTVLAEDTSKQKTY